MAPFHTSDPNAHARSISNVLNFKIGLPLDGILKYERRRLYITYQRSAFFHFRIPKNPNAIFNQSKSKNIRKFVTNDNFSELIRKISPTYNFFEFIY